MRDAVAEVLLERRSLVPRRLPFLIFSAALHVGVALAVLATGRRSTIERLTPVLNIRLAPAPAPPAPADVSAPQPAPPAPVEKKPEPVAKKEPPKKPVEQTLFGKSAEKPVPRPPSPVQRPQRDVATTDAGRGTGDAGLKTRDIAGGSAGVAGLEGGDFPYPIYIDRMLTLIGNHWLRPHTRGDTTTQVYFVIERDGRVRDVKIESPSGNGVFDRAARRAVLEAAPLPPLPFAYSGNYLGVHLTFH